MEEEEISIKHLSKKSYQTSRPTQRFYVPPAGRIITKKNYKSPRIHITNHLTDETSDCNIITSGTTGIIIKDCELGKKEEDLIGKSVLGINLNNSVQAISEDQKVAIPSHLQDSFSISDVSVTNCEDKFHDSGGCKNDFSGKPESEAENNIETTQIVTNVNKSESIQSQTCNVLTESPEVSLDTKLSNRFINMSFEDQNCDTAKQDIVPNQLSFNDNNNVQLNSNDNLYISVSAIHTNRNQFYKDDGDNENHKIQKTIENINRRSKCLIKHVHPDDTLRIEQSEKHTNDLRFNNTNTSYAGFDENNVKESNVSNWEDMIDEENGELHNEHVGEITQQSGCDKQLLKKANDYSSHQNIMLQDLDHVIELCDFPSTFKTHDIIQLYYDAYQDSMYVKWCDDTHALLVLSTPAQAQRALQIEHDIIKSRPMTEASKIATLVANCTDLKPAMKRPPTNMQTARRLINTHLGTKIKLSKETLEQERKILLSAREQKRLHRQNEKDAWEGNPRNTR